MVFLEVVDIDGIDRMMPLEEDAKAALTRTGTSSRRRKLRISYQSEGSGGGAPSMPLLTSHQVV